MILWKIFKALCNYQIGMESEIEEIQNNFRKEMKSQEVSERSEKRDFEDELIK